MTFEPITTHAEFEHRLKDRLRRQRETHRLELAKVRKRWRAERDKLAETLRKTRDELAKAEARAIAAERSSINPPDLSVLRRTVPLAGQQAAEAAQPLKEA